MISEGPLRITRPAIEGAWRRRQAGQRLVVRDAECRGLALMSAGVGPKTVDDVTAKDLRRLLAAEAGRAATARARLGAVSRFFDWCMEAGYGVMNPCALISRSSRPRAPEARARYQRPEQLAGLWHAAEKLYPVWRDLTRFLIAVPCRRGEAARLEWQHLDLAAGTWS